MWLIRFVTDSAQVSRHSFVKINESNGTESKAM